MNIAEAWRSFWPSPDRSPIHEWAAKRIVLRAPYAINGPFSVGNTRHFVDIFSALQDDATREVAVLKPVRGGGSLIGDVYFTWAQTEAPGPFLNAFQTDPVAESHWDKKLSELLKCVGLLPGGRLNWKEVDLANGHTCYTCGPSINNVQSRGMKYVRLDEPWLYPQGIIEEARGRLGDFLKLENSKLLCISQGGPMPGRTLEECDWCRLCNECERNEWTVPCLGCGQYIQPKFFDQRQDGNFAGMRWDKVKLPNGDWNIPAVLATIRFECPLCGHPHMEREQRRINAEWNRAGKYQVVGIPNRRKRLFHWESIIDFPWGELVTMWLEACNAYNAGVLTPKIQFHQKYCARNMDERTIMESGQAFARTVYKMAEKAPEGSYRFLTVDRQEEDLYWWTVREWEPGGKSRRLGFGRAYGTAELEKIRGDHGVEPNHVGVDSGYLPKGDNGVYAACANHGWLALRGDEKHFFVHKTSTGKTVQRSYSQPTYGDPESGVRGTGKRYCAVIRFSKAVYNRRVQTLIDSGMWEEPAGNESDPMDREYGRQMAGRFERRKYSKETNQVKRIWWEGRNDHARDLANMQVLFATLARLLPDDLSEMEK